jgi:hypothetical protein
MTPGAHHASATASGSFSPMLVSVLMVGQAAKLVVAMKAGVSYQQE